MKLNQYVLPTAELLLYLGVCYLGLAHMASAAIHYQSMGLWEMLFQTILGAYVALKCVSKCIEPMKKMEDMWDKK